MRMRRAAVWVLRVWLAVLARAWVALALQAWDWAAAWVLRV